MRTPDDGAPLPPLPEDAGPHERTLYGIYGFSTALVSWTADDWGTTADSVRGLATEVRSVVRALQGADEPWAGPAADSAFASLGQLARSLDARAAEIQDIKTGLSKASESGTTARIAYATEVRSVSTDVERSAFESTPARPPGGVPVPDGTVFDQAGYDRAVSGARAEREAAALKVLGTFGEDMGDAAKRLPVDPVTDPVRIDPGSGPGGPTSGGGGGGSGPGGGGYRPPSGGGGVTLHPTNGGPDGTGLEPTSNPTPTTTTTPTPTPTPTTTPTPTPTPVPVDPGPLVTVDGPTDGSTTPGGGGSVLTGTTGAAPGSTGTGPGIGGAAGMGGMLAGGGAAAIMGRGGLSGGGGRPMVLPGASGAAGSAGRAGSTGAASAAGRSGSTGTSGQGSTGRTGVVGAAGQGAVGSGSGSGGARSGGARAGRYGVPKLGGASGSGTGVVPAGGGAGSRGGRRDERKDAQDVDRLTTEDEETWFDGEDDATPPVWR